MPSVSLPVTPQHFEKPTSGKWAATSCEELDRVTPCGSDHEFSDSPIKIAKFKALKVKREAISSFLADHFQEDLSLYIDELRTFACSAGGLVDDEFRSRIWPVLAANLVPLDEDQDYDAVSCDSDFESAASELSDLPGYAEDAENVDLDLLKEHPEWKQVELDVHRTLARFPPNISEDHRVLLQDELIPLIVRVLQTNSRFHYYQGFHDICLTMVLVCGVEKALRICCQLAHCGVFNNYLLKSLEESVLKELDLMYVILSRVDPQLEMIMRGTQLGSLFALSWPLTWFSHSLQHYQQIVRVFDVLLASQPLLPVYLSTAVVLYRRPAILTTEREMPFLHQLLSTMPNELPLDALCSDAQYLAKLMPPSLLKGRFLEDYSKIAHTPSKTAAQSKLPRYALHLLVAAGAAGFFLLAKSSIVLSDVI